MNKYLKRRIVLCVPLMIVTILSCYVAYQFVCDGGFIAQTKTTNITAMLINYILLYYCTYHTMMKFNRYFIENDVIDAK